VLRRRQRLAHRTGAGARAQAPGRLGAGGRRARRRLGGAAAALAAAYVDAQGRRLSLAARRSCDGPNWLAHREPRAPRPVCALLLELLAAAEAEVAQLVVDGGAHPVGARRRARRGPSNPCRPPVC
jgi:hypothetical protein